MTQLPYKPEHVEIIRRALHGVTREGTSRLAFAGAGYASGGKTGTAQAVGARANVKYNAAALEEHKRDHALYVAAAPIAEPTVALAVIVENAGWGSQSAAPIARRVFDYLLLGQYPSADDIAATRAGKSTAPTGTPRNAADIALPGGAALPIPAAVAAAAAAAPATDTRPAARQQLAAATPVGMAR